MEFRLRIAGIASVQKTCRVDPKVLGLGLWEISSEQMDLIQWRKRPCNGGSPVIRLYDRRTTLAKGGIATGMAY
jgi:hypothetical protein